MFTLSKQADYGLQLVTRLSKLDKNESLSLRVFSEESNISFLFLQKIARKLKAAGIITAHKGVRGGYTLSKPESTISLKTILDAIDGEYAIVECAKKTHGCSKVATCTTKQAWLNLNKDITEKLESVKVSEFV